MNKSYQAFFVDKVTRTFGDNLTAFGLARLLVELLEQQGAQTPDVTISDTGMYYQLTCSPALTWDATAALPYRLCPIRPVRTLKNADSLPTDIPVLDYEADKEQRNLHYEARQKGAEDAPPLPPYWDMERAINNPQALIGYNKLAVDWWQLGNDQIAALTIMFDLYAHTPNGIDAAIQAWKTLDKARGWNISPLATCLQLYNPDQGKGQNKPKADGLSIDNVKTFWLVEWLKAVGLYEAGMTRLVRGAKDRKTFVLAPQELSFSVNQTVMRNFSASMSSETSTRFDILAAIRYARALLNHLNSDDSLVMRLLARQRPKDIVRGFDTAFYKDLGNATATMNVSFIALPGWIRVQTRDDIALYTDPERGVLSHLDQLTSQFNESHSDAFTLLQHLRDFISGDDLSAFFRFTTAFAGYYIGKRERNKYAVQLRTDFIERLIMSTEKRLTPILESEGFQNIAYAIRQSTVTAQYRKQQGDRKYDVRYGLGQNLARKARYPESFITALSDFLHKYNAENAQVMETRSGRYRRSIKTSDIEEVVRLIDDYGSEPIANLLIAYGYARVTHEEELEVIEQHEETT